MKPVDAVLAMYAAAPVILGVRWLWRRWRKAGDTLGRILADPLCWCISDPDGPIWLCPMHDARHWEEREREMQETP